MQGLSQKVLVNTNTSVTLLETGIVARIHSNRKLYFDKQRKKKAEEVKSEINQMYKFSSDQMWRKEEFIYILCVSLSCDFSWLTTGFTWSIVWTHVGDTQWSLKFDNWNLLVRASDAR